MLKGRAGRASKKCGSAIVVKEPHAMTDHPCRPLADALIATTNAGDADAVLALFTSPISVKTSNSSVINAGS
jgi:hypothetical protein